MKIYLSKSQVQESPSLKEVLYYLEEKKYLSIQSQANSERSDTFVLFFNSDKNQAELINNALRVIQNNMRNKIVDDYFINGLKYQRDNKQLLVIRELYDAFISSTRLNQQFNANLGYESFAKAALDKNKDGIDMTDNLTSFVEDKKNNLLKLFADAGISNKNPDFNLQDAVNQLKVLKENKKLLKSKILVENIKSQLRIDIIKQQFQDLINSFGKIADFKNKNEYENDSIDLIYQRQIIENLKLFRGFLEAKIKSELYTQDQNQALQKIREILMKKFNLLKSDRSYLLEKIEKQQKNKDNPHFAEILYEISEANKTIRRKERELANLKNSK